MGESTTKGPRYFVKIDRERCKGCELCVAVCPKKVLAMTSDVNARGQHHAGVITPDDCIGCLQCSDICPDAAIEVEGEA